MAIAQNRLVASVWNRLRGKLGVRLTRFAGVAVASLLTSMIALSVCDGVFHLTSTPSAVVSWFCGAVVSYVLSRWAWERKGKPDVLRETIPFWVISALVVVILSLATKLGYHMASWLHLTGVRHVALVEFVYLVANFVTFVMRFVIFHYVLFTDRTTAARAAATGPDAVPPGPRHAPHPASSHPAASATPGAGLSASQTDAPASGLRSEPSTGRPDAERG